MNSTRIGALVIGGDYRGLGAVRSLGRRGIDVWLLHDADHPLAAASRYVTHRGWWPAGEEAQVGLLCRLAQRRNVKGWVLIPSSDEVVSLVGRHHAELAPYYRLTTPPWDQLAWAHDKRSLYDLADSTGVARPWTTYPASRDEVAALNGQFPLIIKPIAHGAPNPLSRDKAWRVDDRLQLLRRYDEAMRFLSPDRVMLQDFVPGTGDSQFSFAALSDGGQVLASVVARRLRQFPMDFGRLSTFVESVDEPQVADMACRLLAAARHTGLIELEFKRDARDGSLKVLDANPRIWGWHTMTRRSGPDFVYELYALSTGKPQSATTAAAGQRWVRLDLDVATTVPEVLAGRIRARDWFLSLAGPVEPAIFAADDLLPGVIALGQLEYLVARAAAARLRAVIRENSRSTAAG